MSKFVLLAAAGLTLALAGPAAAQSGFLKNLARQAAAAAIQNAAQPRPAAAPAAEAQGVEAEAEAEPSQQYAAAETTAPMSGPAPWPINVGARTVKYPSDLAFSPELEADRKAFVEFSKVKCNDCEGGYSFDAWAQQIVRLDGSYKAWEKKLGGLALGETISWKGAQSTGTITVVGEEAVGDWPCKQLKWTLKKPQASAERPGLICYGKAGRYDGAESWTIVF
ncbi:MAG: hypothetical protein KKE02_21740 [Alphaproteobacteria bacterium]|nr:hypothetical protein [Alphaproteobacteria bacterium]MBU1515966.1 hypothetical protein [Alphaproteobacteria bacterium]MBU2092819.1 hypothetical protein [Alphaproteobacteria bacterium]MBU2153656.1 hypothetical protein [Alphaproteobacteria bacterium]MBU2308284.1 hypothetical protein [Alphaproteobacteria bacterium]